MSGFTDTVEPSNRLMPPKAPEEFSQGVLLDLFNDMSDLVSPTYWITEAYNAVFGFNPLDEVIQWFAGEPARVAEILAPGARRFEGREVWVMAEYDPDLVAWEEVKYEIFYTSDLDDITAGARRMTAEARAARLRRGRSAPAIIAEDAGLEGDAGTDPPLT